MLKEGKDVSILDKAIKEKKRRETRQREYDKNIARSIKRAALLGLTDGVLFSSNNKNDMMTWEEDAIKNNGYEPYNFEEELEEDDYYFDDDK